MLLGENRQNSGSGYIVSEETVKETICVVAGIDAGSTETRVCLADKQDCALFVNENAKERALERLLETYKIPSTYAEVSDQREVTAVTNNLEDNYDSTIVMVHNSAEKPLITRSRILRGRKILDATGVVPRYLDSSTNKTDNVIFYMNIIDSLGYAIMQKYNGAIPDHVIVHLVLSVRPKELTNICKQKMTDNLKGSYIFNWKSVRIAIEIPKIEFSTEPEAQIPGTITVCDMRSSIGIDRQKNTELADRMANSYCYIHIEGGGSSIGIEVVRDHKLIGRCSSTFALGGNYLAQIFIDRVREKFGRTVTREAAMQAIETSMLRSGRSLVDVSDILADCKNQVAMDITERLRHEVLDVAKDEFTIQDVEFISLAGRLFRKDSSGDSIGEYMAEYVHQLSPNTEIITLEDNFIPQGNLVIGIQDETFETEPEEVSVDSEGASVEA